MRVNLNKKDKNEIPFNYFRVIMIIIMLVVIAGISILQFTLIMEKKVLKQEIKSLDNQLDVYLAKEKEYRVLKDKVNMLKNLPQIPDYNWDGPIEALGYITPPGGVIKNFSLINNNLNIEGIATMAEELREFSLSIERSPYFKNVNLTTLEKENEVEFLITAELAEKGVE